MKTLYLLRHAKSSRDDPSLADHDRPLAPRGRKAAPRVGAYMKANGMRPDLVIASTALRAADTADLVLAAIGHDVPVEREHGLYLCGSHVLLERLRDAPDTVAALMLVGHNPDLHELATLLAGEGPPKALAAMREKFPTGACAVLAFDRARWCEVDAGSGRLIDWIVPRGLA
ncbi:SixA phosphatase family protein [Azospirillum halopraeferens]|uniref:SixA phosphatase family protein n=1 Tax=Azospirillum halopraeferens TaxID=34010 RepID=UPI000429DF56|nr:histidine phosphatase family protein [Azospirillum halopraeferens]